MATLFRFSEMKKKVLKNEEPIRHFKTAEVTDDEICNYPEEIANQYFYDLYSNTYKIPDKIWADGWRAHGPYWYDDKNPNYIPLCIGGSEIAILYAGSVCEEHFKPYEGAHGNNYKSVVEFFHEKLEIPMPKLGDDDNKADIFFTGHNLEEAVIRDFEYLYKKDHPEDEIKIFNDTSFFQCGRKNENGDLVVPYCCCNLDRIVEINGIRFIGECKTCNYNSEDYALWTNGIVPLKYRLQCAWYMLCTNLPGAFITCKTGLSVNDTYYYFIERDFQLENWIIEMSKEFVKCLETGKEPDLDDSQIDIYWDYQRRYEGVKQKKETMQMPEEYKIGGITVSLADKVIELMKLLDDAKALKAQITGIESQIKEMERTVFAPVMVDNLSGTIKIDEDTLEIIRKPFMSSARHVNIENFISKYPELADTYTRVLDEKLLFKEHPEILKDEEVLEEAKISSSAGKMEVKKWKPKKKKGE